MKRVHLIITIVFLFTLCCVSQEKKLPNNFDFGKFEEGFYQNDFFELEINYSPDWIVQDRQQMNNLIEVGKDLISGDDENLKSVVKASMVNTAYLLTVFKYEVGSAVDYNPSFMVVAENTKNFPGIKNGSDYLFHAKKLLKLAQIKYYFEKDVFEKKIAKSAFYVMEAKVDYMGMTIIQEYFTTVINSFSLSFILSYTSEEEKNELYEIINSIEM